MTAHTEGAALPTVAVPSTRVLTRELAWHGVVSLMAVHLVVTWHSLTRPFLNLREYVHGTGLKPYQYRALPALVARPLVAALDASGVSARLAGRAAPFNNPVVLAFMALQIPLAVWLVREVRSWLADRSGNEELGFWAAPGVLAVLPANLYGYNESNWYFPYDLPGVAFTFALLGFASKRRWLPFYLLFPLATLNRETTFLVTAAVVFVSLEGLKGSPGGFRGWLGRAVPKALPHIVAQGALWVAVKAALFYAYRANASEGEFQLFANKLTLNLSYLAKPMWWPQMLSTMAFLWVPCFALWRRHEDPWLRAAMLCFPLYGLAMLLVGHLVEIRIFAEFTPVFYTAAVLLARRSLRA